MRAKISLKYHINQAKEEQQRTYWQKRTPQEVIKFENRKKRRKFILKLIILVIILCVSNIAYFLIFRYGNVDEIVAKLWGGYWTPFVLINSLILYLWYFWLTEDEKKSFKEIKSKFYS